MTKEEKSLFIKDLCARLPYGIWFQSFHSECNIEGKGTFNFYIDINTENATIKLSSFCDPYSDNNKPYLRPLSSMTEEEEQELNRFGWNLHRDRKESYIGAEDKDDPLDYGGYRNNFVSNSNLYTIIDFLNAHHFDYNELIDMGLAIEAPEDMYLYNQHA